MPAFVTTEYVDDLDGVTIDSKNVDTVTFSYRGTEYSLVLTAENGSQFDKDMARYIKAAKRAQAQVARGTRAKAKTSVQKSAKSSTAEPSRKAAMPRKAVRKAAPSRKVAARKPDAAPDERQRAKAIREWAAANGHTVSARGRISAAVLEAFDAAQ